MNTRAHFGEDDFARLRHMMVETQIRSRGVREERLLDAMRHVLRHEFVAPEFRNQAYEDHPLPIGAGQTISQPYIHAAMLEAAEIRAQDRCLEIGTGSGYQTALMAELANEVLSIERQPELARTADAVLHALGYSNVRVIVGDGTRGLPEHAPYDVIVVSAAAPSLPEPLVQQLAEGGRMIVPVGCVDQQELLLVRKINGHLQKTRLDPCRFVPLIGEEGFRS